MIHSSGNVLGIELHQKSERIQCPYCMRYSMGGIIYCDCGTWLILSEQVRRLNQERFNALTIPFFAIKKGTHRGYRCGRSEGQKSYHQAKVVSRTAKTKGFSSIDGKFMQPESIAKSQMEIGWTEETCLHMEAIAGKTTHMLRRLLKCDTTILGE